MSNSCHQQSPDPNYAPPNLNCYNTNLPLFADSIPKNLPIFPDTSTLQASKNGPFKCEKCSSIFMFEAFYNLHQDKHIKEHMAAIEEGSVEQTEKAPKTPRKQGKSKSKAAKLRASVEEGIGCRQCFFAAATVEELVAHMTRHNTTVNQCGNCEYETNNRGNFKRHVLSHCNIRPFKCDLCPFSATQKTHLKKHMVYHNANGSFPCDLCTYSCSDKANFNRHKNLHLGSPVKIKKSQSSPMNNPPSFVCNSYYGAGSGHGNTKHSGPYTVDDALHDALHLKPNIPFPTRHEEMSIAGSSFTRLTSASTPTLPHPGLPISLAEHADQVAAMTTDDIAMAADIAMTTRELMSRSIDVSRLFNK